MKSLAFLAALMVVATPAQAQQAVGVAAAVRNDVRIRKPGGPLPRPVALRQRIALADQVQTGAKSQLQVLLLDRSVFTVGQNARLTIDRYVYDPNRGTRSMGATVTRGAFRFMSGRRTSGGSSTINTPVASIGVRGTMVDGVVGEDAVLIAANEPGVARGVRGDPDTASLIVLRGPGVRTQGNVAPGAIDVTAGGRTVTAERPMLAIYIPYEGAQPIGPFTISNSGLMQMQAVLFPALAQRLGLRPPVDPNRTYAPATDWPPAGTERPRPPGFPRGLPPGGFDSGPPPPGGYIPQLPYGNLPGVQQPRAPRQQGPVQQRQAPAAAPSDPQPAAIDPSPPQDSLAPPDPKSAPDPAGAPSPSVQDDSTPKPQPQDQPNGDNSPPVQSDRGKVPARGAAKSPNDKPADQPPPVPR